MKKIIAVFLAITTLASVSSCTKDTSVKPATSFKNVVADKTDVGQGD